ncbi:Flp pilus assembly protein CpaB [Sediminibacillus massiliensis]|uniref:Flp pilus assembly protein CpaB n=1 Tax=Sediminibacillus massiliensis TaxID=1926277 RepID=UPI0009888E04|nr:Flp pilus assembly protein CpaB [Sediminibacillus massiliensis]
MKPKKILLLALMSGLITTFIFYFSIDQLRPTAAEEPAMVSVVTASQDLEENQQINEESIALVEMPEEQVHPQAIKDSEAVIGKFTATAIKSGETIMTHRLQQQEEAAMISKKVQEGFRAVSISVDFVKSVSNLIEPGDFVDVVLTEEETAETEVVLEDVKVLAVGQRMVEKKEGEAPVEYAAVTLELKPKDSVEVIEASSKGILHLVLHSKLLPATEADESEETEEGEEVLTTTDANIIVTPTHSLIRTEPDLAANIVTVVDKGTSLHYLEEKEKDEDDRLWLRVETPDKKQGWISSRIVKQENE